jgi:hypothetical protein
MDIIQAVDGSAVNTVDAFLDAVNSKSVGATVALRVLRVSQNDAGVVNRETLNLSVPAQALLPDVTAGGQALLDAIWQERRVELAMEQHRWFDLIRQGRAAEVLAAAGKNFIAGKHELYPIPSGEVEVAGLQQNPGY